MIRNRKEEEKLKEMGIKDPRQFISHQIGHYAVTNDYSCNISFNFVIGIVFGILITLMFVYVC